MRHPHRQLASVALKLAFPLALGFGFLAAVYIRFYSGLIPVRDLPNWPAYVAYFVLSVALWSALEWRAGLVHRCLEESSFARWLWRLAQVDLVTLALVSSSAFFWRAHSFSRITVALFWSLQFLLSATAGALVRAWLRRTQASATRTWVFLIGDRIEAEAVRRECLPGEPEAVWRRFPTVAAALAELPGFDPPQDCRELLVALPAGHAAALDALAEALERLPVPASVALAGVAAGEAHATPSFVVLSTGPGAGEAFDYFFSKRLMDVIVSTLGLVLLAPGMAAIALVSRRRFGRPILFAQERVGRGGRRFRLYKFRTLPAASIAESDTLWTSAPPDPWGRFLRATWLDELPQLLNVLRGDMSLVGPRPERPHFVEQFRRQLPFYATRHRFQVGITGWAQIHGLRGDTSIPQRVEHDLYYLRHWSLALDFRILWMTAAVFFRQLRAAAVEARSPKVPDARSV